MPSSDPRLKTRARKALRAHIARQHRGCEHPHCQRPGQPIDYTPGATGPLAYHLDEITPRAEGGSPLDPANVRPTHQVCNTAAGARWTNTHRGRSAAPPTWTSDRW